MTENKRYFIKEYDGQNYIFDSKEKADSEPGAMTMEDVIERLNESQVAIDELFDIMCVSTKKLLEIVDIIDDFKEYMDNKED